jgi:hypothetical protein
MLADDGTDGIDVLIDDRQRDLGEIEASSAAGKAFGGRTAPDIQAFRIAAMSWAARKQFLAGLLRQAARPDLAAGGVEARAFVLHPVRKSPEIAASAPRPGDRVFFPGPLRPHQLRSLLVSGVIIS